MKGERETLAQTGDLSNLRHVRRMLLLATIVLGVALLAPVAANARVVPNKSIGQVRLGASEPRLRDALQPPDRNIRTTGLVTGLPLTLWVYKDLEIEFEGGNTVTTIRTSRLFERTKKGAGVGTPKRLLRKLHPKLRCTRGKNATCSMTRTTKRVSKGTTFDLEDGRVTTITVWRFLRN